MGVIFAFFAIFAIITAIAEEEGGIFAVAFFLLVLAGACIAVFALAKMHTIVLHIFGETRISLLMSTHQASQGVFMRLFGGARQGTTVKIRVYPDVASVMVEELGAIILDAASGAYDEQ